MMFTMENGDIYTVILKDMGINITKKDWAHMGSGEDAVNKELEFIPNSNDNRTSKLTGLNKLPIEY
ncbi:hypothetical protein, partial [Klebsiella pneumoniae]|uniref:hypothetical protein n=1 Tax=Klebsiella pneumoniae TaxID=573 RepID=UPI0039685840